MRTPCKSKPKREPTSASTNTTSVYEDHCKDSATKSSTTGEDHCKESATKSSRGRFRYPKLRRFCFTRQEFHNEHGLSLEGKVKQNVSNEDLPESEWLTVFNKTREKGSKLFLHMLRPEYVSECRLLFQKVYQAPPVNNEITYKFAMLFAYERCQAAKKDPAGHKVAWAIFAEQVVEHCKKLPGGIKKKLDAWIEVNESGASASQRAHRAPPKQTPAEQGPEEERSIVLPSDSICANLVVAHAEQMVERKKLSIEQLKTTLDSKRLELQKRRETLLKTEGSSSAAAVLALELEKLKKKDCDMKKAGSADSESARREVAARMSALSDALALLGVDKTLSTIKAEVDLLEKEVSKLEREELDRIRQSAFCHRVQQQAQSTELPRLLLVPDPSLVELEEMVQIPGVCVACGEAFVGLGAVGLYRLQCGHQYHPLCFAFWVECQKECAESTCGQSISKSAQSWLLGSDPPIDKNEAPPPQVTPKSKLNTTASSIEVTPTQEASVPTAEMGPEATKSNVKENVKESEGEKEEHALKENEEEKLDEAAQQGVDAVERMMTSEDDKENPGSPVFLSDILDASRKQKKNTDSGPSKKTKGTPNKPKQPQKKNAVEGTARKTRSSVAVNEQSPERQHDEDQPVVHGSVDSACMDTDEPSLSTNHEPSKEDHKAPKKSIVLDSLDNTQPHKPRICKRL